MNILSHVNSSNNWNVIKYFHEFNQKFVKEGITYHILSSSRATQCQKKYYRYFERLPQRHKLSTIFHSTVE